VDLIGIEPMTSSMPYPPTPAGDTRLRHKGEMPSIIQSRTRDYITKRSGRSRPRKTRPLDQPALMSTSLTGSPHRTYDQLHRFIWFLADGRSCSPAWE
jgi:hypothetical protein